MSAIEILAIFSYPCSLLSNDSLNLGLLSMRQYTHVCSLPKAISGGCEEIISRIRKVIGAWTFGKLAVNPKIGIGIWQDLLFNYL